MTQNEEKYADAVLYICPERRVWRKLKSINRFELMSSEWVHKNIHLQKVYFPLNRELLVYGGEGRGGGLFRISGWQVEDICKHANYPYDVNPDSYQGGWI